MNDIKKTLATNRKNLAVKYKVKSIGVFGSFVKGKQQKKSDIDILVEFTETVDFFQFLELEEHLEKLLGIKVDLVTKRALKPYIKENILKEIVYV
jgi:hypothetical protein